MQKRGYNIVVEDSTCKGVWGYVLKIRGVLVGIHFNGDDYTADDILTGTCLGYGETPMCAARRALIHFDEQLLKNERFINREKLLPKELRGLNSAVIVEKGGTL